MTLKVCGEPGCPELQREGRCITHRRQRERERGTRQARGYGADHDALRARWAPLVATGNVKCWRCGEYLPADETFDLGHDDNDRSKYRGPEHVACNRRTAGRVTRCVTLVYGPPCAGKTTHVRDHAAAGDVVVDYDLIAQELGSPVTHGHDHSLHAIIDAEVERRYDLIANNDRAQAWIVTLGSTSSARTKLAARVHATAEVLVDADDETLTTRAMSRPNSARTLDLIRLWREAHSLAG